MHRFETNDWLVVNNIIYKIYSTFDLTEMRKSLLEQIKLLVNFDSADFFLSRKDGKHGLENGVGFNSDIDELIEGDKEDYSRGIMYSGKCMVYRETDIMDDAERVKTYYYKNFYLKNRWHYALQMILAYNKEFLGVITLYRTIGKDDFVYDDIFLLDMLKEHLAFRLHCEKEKQKDEKIDIIDAAEKYHLTKREVTVLKYLLSGTDNAVICNELVISDNTLKKHILNIYRKLNVNSRMQLLKTVKANNQ